MNSLPKTFYFNTDMKKILFTGCMLLWAAVAANAQQQPKNCPENYWFIEGQAGAGYTEGEASFGKLIAPAAAISIGKSFNPIIAARLQANGWKGKGGWKNKTTEHPENSYTFNYAQVALDAMFNLTNICCGYKEGRCFNLVGIIGVGYAHSSDYDNIPGLSSTEAVNSAVARAGIQTNFRINKHWDLNMELTGNAINDSFNAKKGSVNDWQVNLLAGFTYKFGHKASKAVEDPCAATVAELNGKINTQRGEIEELQRQLQAKPKTVERVTTVTEKIMEAYIPFKIGKSRIASEQQIHLYQIAQFLKENPNARITVTGYADAKTGNKEVNRKLSEKRAQAIADNLIKKYGIENERIAINGKGDTLQPFEENSWNRVAILITK